MGKDRLEEYIKDQVYDYDSVVDTEELWNNIQEKKKPKRFLWVYLTFGIVILGIMIATVWLKDMDSPMSSNAIESVEHEQTKNEKSKNLNPIINEDKSIIKSKSLDNVPSSLELNENNALNRDQFKEADNDVPVVEENTVNEREKSVTPFKQPEIIRGNSINEDQDVKGNGEKNISEQSNFGNLITTTTTTRNNSTEEDLNSIRDTKKLSEASNLIAANKLSSNLPEKVELLVAVNRLEIKELLYTGSLDPVNLNQKITPLDRKDDIFGYWFAGVGLSFYKGERVLSRMDTLTEERDSILRLRQNQEEFMESWGMDVSIGYQHRTGLFVRSGVGYNQINDRATLEFQNMQTAFQQIDTLMSFLQTITPVKSIRYNKLRMVDIPVSIGYYKNVGSIGLSTEIGLNVNIKTQASGNIINNASSFMRTDDSRSEIFKTNISYSYELSLGLHRSIGNQWNISFHPTWRYYPKSFTVSSYAIDQRYQLFGAKLKLTKSF